MLSFARNEIILGERKGGYCLDEVAVIRVSAYSFSQFSVNRIRFKTLPLVPNQQFDGTKIHQLRYTLFEMRSDKQLFNCQIPTGAFIGVIEGLVERTALSPDGRLNSAASTFSSACSRSTKRQIHMDFHASTYLPFIPRHVPWLLSPRTYTVLPCTPFTGSANCDPTTYWSRR